MQLDQAKFTSSRNKMLLTEDEMLRAHFEKVTREAWGWSNFVWDGERYESRHVQAGWQCFRYGFTVGKKQGIEESTANFKEALYEHTN